MHRYVVVLLLSCVLPASTSHLQYWCSSEKKVTSFGACTPLPCDATPVTLPTPPPSDCTYPFNVGDVVKFVGAQTSPVYGLEGTLVCGTVDGKFLVLWDHYTGGDDGLDADMYCAGGCAPYPALTAMSGSGSAKWVTCNSVSLVCAACTPSPTYPETNAPYVGHITKELLLGWSTSTLRNDHPDSVVGGTPTSIFAEETFGVVAVQILHKGLTGPDSIAQDPEVYCTLTVTNNVAVIPTPTVLAVEGVAIFDDLMLANAGPATFTIECELGRASVGYAFDTTVPDNIITVDATISAARPPTPAPDTPKPLDFIPPADRPGAWRYAPQYRTVHPWQVPYARAPADGPLPPSGSWSGYADCDRDPRICPFDCQMTDWQPWSKCNDTCGDFASQTRYRTVLAAERYGGTPCSSYALIEYSPCNRFPCGEMCTKEVVGDGTTSGTPGSYTCGKYAAIKAPMLYQQGLTSHTMLEGCAAIKPGVATDATFLFETKVVLKVGDAVQVEFSGGSIGSSCNLMTQRPCVQIVAEISKNGDTWKECGTFDHQDHLGVQYEIGAHTAVQCLSPYATDRLFIKFKAIEHISAGTIGSGAITGGQAIPSTWGNRNDVSANAHPYGGYFGSGQYATVFITRAAVQVPCVKDCVLGEWGDWSICSNPCNGGRQRRERLVIVSPSRGAACDVTAEGRACNTHHCDSDCDFTAFGTWSDCSTNCGGGTQVRTREIIAHANGNGQACPTVLTETQLCNTHVCGDHCQVSSFTIWGPCSALCGGGASVRTRTIVQNNTGAGDACPHLFESRSCNTNACTGTPQDLALPPNAPEDTTTDAPTLSPLAQTVAPATGTPVVPGIPTLRLKFRSSPATRNEASGTRFQEYFNEVVTAFVAELDEYSLDTLAREVPDGVKAFVVATLFNQQFNLSGTTKVPLASTNTAAFTDLIINGDGAEELMDIALTIVLEPSVPGIDTSSIYRKLLVRTTQSENLKRYLIAGYATPLDSFDTAQWKTNVATALNINVDAIDVLRVASDESGVSPLTGCAKQDGALGGVSVFFSITADRSVEETFLKSSLEPGNALSAESCGATYALAGTYENSIVNSFLSLVDQKASLRETSVPTEAPSTSSGLNWPLILGVLLPVLLLLWLGVAGLLWYKQRVKKRNRNRRNGPDDDKDEDEGDGDTPGNSTEGLVEENPIQRAFPERS